MFCFPSDKNTAKIYEHLPWVKYYVKDFYKGHLISFMASNMPIKNRIRIERLNHMSQVKELSIGLDLNPGFWTSEPSLLSTAPYKNT